MKTDIETIKVNGIDYVRADSIPVKPSGNRAVIVIDRGWIVAGDVEEKDGRIYLSRCSLVFRWKTIGFAAVIDDPSRADIRDIADVDIPAASEIFRIPVSENWGK
jgi:hypothetical protein